MVHLLDANVLIALADHGHSHHEAARTWFSRRSRATFATCPITQGALLRVMFHRGRANIEEALLSLRSFTDHPAHQFWPEDLSYETIRWHGVIGHRQITDAYLAALARKHKGKLATLDRGLAALHHDVAELIPV